MSRGFLVERCWLILDSLIEDYGVMKSHFFSVRSKQGVELNVSNGLENMSSREVGALFGEFAP